MNRLTGKVALITGAASGLGAVAARIFASEGARIVIADTGDGFEVVADIVAAGGEAVCVRTDVTSESDMVAAVACAVDTFGSLDVMYNNAGVMLSTDDNPVDTPLSTWDTTMEINVKGVMLGCRAAIPVMQKQGSGSIVNVASFVAHMGAATPQVAYTASKGAVLAMTREIAVIYARQGIRANALCPGPVMTPLLAKFLADDAQRQRRLVHIPMGRFGEAEEIAKAALFLASDDSSWMTGQSLIVDGGITAAYVTPQE